MPHSANKKSAAGIGNIRKKTVTRKGKEYTYWEARYTAGYDPGTGKQLQRSITGKTQKEVAQKLKAATTALDNGTYQAPNKMTVGQWLDIWIKEYLGAVKPSTSALYASSVKLYIRPFLGAVRLEALSTHQIQSMYNTLQQGDDKKAGLSPKTIKNIHAILHKALQQAVANSLVRFNPSDACILPRSERKTLHPLDETQIAIFIKAIKGHPYENLYLVTLFTGMRQGEVLGLTWDSIDFSSGVITVKQQLQVSRDSSREYHLVTTKNSRSRSITAAPFVMDILKKVKAEQGKQRLKAGSAWDNPADLVFTNALGGHLSPHVVYNRFKAVMKSIGSPETRFHDLRHSYAVAAIRSGDDIKTVQDNLGHATASFTLDVYGHVTEQMKQESANRMENFIRSVSG